MASRALEFLELQVRQSRFLALLAFEIDRNIDLGKIEERREERRKGNLAGPRVFVEYETSLI